MEDSVAPQVLLETLKRKRAHRRGQITRIQRRLSTLQSKHLKEIPVTDVDLAIADLTHEIKLHESLHEQIEDLLSSDAEALSIEHTERDIRDDTHASLHLQLSNLRHKLDIWHTGTDLSAELDTLLAIKEPSRPHYQAAFKDFKKEVSTLARRASPYMDDDYVRAIVKPLRDGITAIQADITSADGPSLPSTPVDSASRPAPRAAPITVELPKFDGHPVHWRHFETLFSTAIRTRASGFSNLDIRCLLMDALLPLEAKEVVRSFPMDDAPLDDLLCRLRQRFGRPQLVVPLLVQKIVKPTTFTHSYEGLRTLTDQVLMGYDSLKPFIGDSLSEFLTHLAKASFDKSLKDDWEKYASDKLDKPNLADLRTFVDKRLLHMSPTSEPLPSPAISTRPSTVPTSGSQPPRKKPPSKCVVCGDNHALMRCNTFVGYDVERRNRLIRDKRLCLNCFSDQHSCRFCTSKFSCKSCGGRHHSLLHKDKDPATPQAHLQSTAPPDAGNYSVVASSSPVDQVPHAVPSFPNTIMVTLENEGRTARARAILDTGAGVSIMSEKLASALKLKRFPQHMSLSGSFGEERCKFCVVTNLLSHSRSFQSKPITFTVVSKLKPAPVPSNREAILKLPSLHNFPLADPDLGGDVDLFLGNMDIDECVFEGSLRFDGLKAIHTPFGLSIAGPMHDNSQTLLTSVVPDDLQHDLSRLWELDQVPEAPSHSPEDADIIKDFNNTYQRNDGRFSVSLPKVKNPPSLGDSRRQAVKRLLANEKHLSSKRRLEDFNAVVQEYLDLGHAHVIPQCELYLHPHFYLPIHGVFKESSSTTKLRAVFDASAKSSTGTSLNDILLPGPNLYPQLPDVIVRFRRHKVGLSADISKMFREILLNPPERDFHRFLTRDAANSIVDSRMERLTFGVNCSPYLATQVLHTLANLSVSSHPVASSAILSDFYVDDFLSGADDVDAADKLRTELCDLLSKAGMTLRKWRSNSLELRHRIPDHLLEKDSSSLTLTPSNQAPKALGIHWDVDKDTLHVSIPPITPSDATVTKRVIASGTAGVFDVLGLFAPAIIPARILFQETWKRSLPWDKPVPEDIRDRWDTWIHDLPSVNSLAIPRRLSPSQSSTVFQSLHGFCDASSVAYGVAIYLRTVSESGSISTTLVIAKARVLPVKPITIPRAELLGAHLLAKMLSHTSLLLEIPPSQVFAWSDSEIVLYWLPKNPSQLVRFVANRVHAIRDLVPPSCWRHVKSGDNPADLASRGVRAPDLATSSLWWSGPPWLTLSPDKWPFHKLSKPVAESQCLSIRPDPQLVPSQKQFLTTLWNRFSSFHTLNKVVAWILRFASNSRPSNKVKLKSDLLGPSEISTAKHLIFKLSQPEAYPEVFIALRRCTGLPKNHALSKHNIVLSSHGHLLINSRVRDPHSPTSPCQLIPLSTKSMLIKLLVRTLHITYSHAGISALASIVSSTFYIPNLRNLLKEISRSCPSCQRAYASPLQHSMGMLPSNRTTPAPPFDRTGVDFAGPFVIRQGYTRKPTLVKTYAAVFVCMCTKAVHLELCTSLSTADFLATLQRFVARRGCPSHIFSDNGTNFIGAREEIRELQKLTESSSTRQAVSNFANSNSIQWHHIPPRAPHFGGLWEAAVKSMKTLLRKNLKPHSLRYEELYTLLTDIEAILNSRPLAPLHSDDVAEGTYLTAGHFLVGRPLKAAPTPRPPSGKISSLRRWNLVSRLTSDLWTQWLGTYLASCSERAKWTRQGQRLAIRDLVYVKDETLRIRDWPLAIVEKVFPGDDGEIRAVQIRCHGKSYTRPANKMIPFISDEPAPNHSPPRRMSGTQPKQDQE